MVTVEYTSEELANERWRPFPFELNNPHTAYFVSDLGRIRSTHTFKNGRVRTIIRKHSLNHKGYPQVSVCKGNGAGQFTRMVHTVVMGAFAGPRPNGLQTNHRDGVKSNNRLHNLEYCTPKENMYHANKILNVIVPTRARNHMRPEQVLRGEAVGTSRLTEEKVREIRRLYIPGVTRQSDLAERFGVAQSTINFMLLGLTWAHVQ